MGRRPKTTYEGRYFVRKLQQPERWSISVRMPADDEHPNRWEAPRRKITAPDYQHALSAAKAYEHELLFPEETAAKAERERRRSLTVDDFMDMWERHRDAAKVQKRTLDREKVERRRIRKYFGDYVLAKLGIDEIMTVEKQMADDGVSANALYTTHRDLKRILRYAVREGYITSNPCDSMEVGEKPKRAKVRKNVRDERRITPEEIARLNAALQQAEELDGLHVAIWLALATGMRRGEVLGLQWRDVDFPKRRFDAVIRVRRQLNDLGELTEPKTEQSARELPVGRTARLFLERWRDEQAAKIGKKVPQNAPVCSNANGGYMDVTNFERGARRFFVRHGLGEFTGPKQTKYKGATFHSLRRAYATQLIADGTDPKTVQGLLGHEDILTTLNYYAEVLESSKVKVVHMFDQAHLAMEGEGFYPQNDREAELYSEILEEGSRQE